ncbi:MAG: FAD-dependent thymidylate synthase [Clostridia bacterium]|nr:FAD-dependent thymidylate synthase [Clostridia bacterium]
MNNPAATKAVILGLSDSGETIPSCAGRISTREGTATEIFHAATDPVKNANLIQKVTQSGHNSTIEHCVYNLAFENISVFAEQFLIEFRLASFTVKSRRYVDFTNSGYYVPSSLGEEAKKRYTDGMQSFFDAYARLCALGVPKEDARFVLPYCLHSNFYCTVNAREFLNMLTQMLYGRGAAIAELRAIGESLAKQARKLTPGIMTDFDARAEKKSESDFPAELLSALPAKKESEPVRLLNYTPNASATVCAAAAAIYNPSADVSPLFGADASAREKVLDWLISSPRPRALENAVYTFEVNGVSLSCLTHFARHRMQSIQIPSLTKTNRDGYVLPETVRGVPEAEKLYADCFRKAKELYAGLKSLGMSDNALVYTLLSGNTIDIVTTMNARELLLFFKLRCCTRAQWEIRDFAERMLLLCREAEPEIFRHYGPSCFIGACPEGRMCCGRQAEIRKKYGSF